MRYVILAFALLIPTLAWATDPPPRQYQPTAAVLLNQALECENIASGQYAQSQAKIADLTKQLADLTKERDEYKASAHVDDELKKMHVEPAK